jgi:hypothetical protein
MSEEKLQQLEQIAANLEYEADDLQREADNALGLAEDAWQIYYAYDPETNDD